MEAGRRSKITLFLTGRRHVCGGDQSKRGFGRGNASPEPPLYQYLKKGYKHVEQRLGTEARPLRVAIVGAGPAGFYAAEALLKQKDLVVAVDFFNRFPTPFGLVREGVAPDHQSIKSVVRIYDKIASDPRVRYFGNVTFGALPG